ncbi:MAG: hypothetical protein JW850_18200 [Thermoflexales bacterium]|nr:hypothetical protein [Thermoflexales bacterium]
MDAHLVKHFRDRWQAVAAVELEEQRAASVELRWQQLNALLQIAIGLELPLDKRDDEDSVRRRWAKLKGGQP